MKQKSNAQQNEFFVCLINIVFFLVNLRRVVGVYRCCRKSFCMVLRQIQPVVVFFSRFERIYGGL